MLGICFGHQIVGRALNVPVGVNPLGWELSATPVTLTATGKAVFPELSELSIMQFHHDIVESAPAGTEVLGYTDVCGVQGFYKPRSMFTLQGHPEFDEEVVGELLEKRAELGNIPEALAKDAERRLTDRNDGPVAAKAMVRFLLE